TLAGYIVQRVSGEPFSDYINHHIFSPLGMTKTTFAQPLPENLKPLMSSGYKVASGGAKSFEVVQAWPAGSVSTSAVDMTHFIIAHLQNGKYGDAQILRPETAELMHSREVSGRYLSSRRSQGNLLEALNPFGEVKVSGHSDGSISVEELKDFNGEPKKLHEIAPLVYRDVNGQDKVAFKRDANGKLYF